jgi:hypothetical protein
MKKIPTLFLRDEQDRRYVTSEVNPECQWVLDGEGVATRKYDGTCVMLDEDGNWWARREVKPGKSAPPNFRPIETDGVTMKTVGWEPIDQSPFAKFHAEALAGEHAGGRWFKPGTYELIGPKINGNPEGWPKHALLSHEHAQVITLNGVDIASAVVALGQQGREGIVWHHPDGRMAKLKARDIR